MKRLVLALVLLSLLAGCSGHGRGGTAAPTTGPTATEAEAGTQTTASDPASTTTTVAGDDGAVTVTPPATNESVRRVPVVG